MMVIGVALMILGAALLVAEAHVPAGILGAAGGVSLAAGAAVAIAAAGGGLVLIVPVVVGAGAIAALWLLIATRKAPVARGPAARRSAATLERSARGLATLGRFWWTARSGARAGAGPTRMAP